LLKVFWREVVVILLGCLLVGSDEAFELGGKPGRMGAWLDRFEVCRERKTVPVMHDPHQRGGVPFSGPT
jgi:hypothetical protein